MLNFDERYRQRAEKILLSILLILFSLYVLNAVGSIENVWAILKKRRYLHTLWVILGIYLIVSRGRIDWDFFCEKIVLVLPIAGICIFLYFYHDHVFELFPIKYVLLFILAGSVICKKEGFGLRDFFVVNSLSCVAIFSAAIYQIYVLGYPVPNGGTNQNIFASMAAIIGNVSFFSLLYKNLNKWDRWFFALCGILAIWVALRTTCRTAYVTEVVVASLFSFLACKRLGWPRRKVVEFLLLVVAFLFLVVLVSPSITENKFKVIPFEILEFLGVGDKETTSSSIGLRLAMWKVAFFNIIPNHWGLGIGEVYQVDLLKMIPNSNIDKDFLSDLMHLHNEGINIFVAGGLLLFIVSNWLLYRLFVIAKNEPVQLCLLVGTVVWGMTEVAFRHKPFLIVFLSIWLLYECAVRNGQYQEVEEGSVLVHYCREFGLCVAAGCCYMKKLPVLIGSKMVNLQSRALCKNLQVLSTLIKLPLARILTLRNSENPPKKILAVCVAHMGDVLCLMPSLFLLRKLYPDAEISVLVPHALYDFFKRGKAFFTPIPYDEKNVLLNLKLYLRVQFYDEAYVFWDKRELLLTQAIGAKRIITYEKFKCSYYKILANDFCKEPEEINLEGYFAKLIIAKEGVRASEALKTLQFSPENFFSATPQALAATREKVVILHTCCKSPCRFMPPAYWREIADYVANLGYAVLFTGYGQYEKEFIEKCDPDNRYQHAVGTYSIDELTQKLLQSSLLITIDTSILHLAKFTGIKTLALCGGSDPRRIAPSPFFSNASFCAVRSRFDCEEQRSHCQRLLPKYCYHWDGVYAGCMKALKVEEICRQIDELLPSKSRAKKRAR